MQNQRYERSDIKTSETHNGNTDAAVAHVCDEFVGRLHIGNKVERSDSNCSLRGTLRIVGSPHRTSRVSSSTLREPGHLGLH